MALPDAKTLFGGATDEDDGEDSLTACLREMHGHMASGNHAAAAEAFRTAHRIAAADAKAGGSLSDLSED
jgi:hypothetical protein